MPELVDGCRDRDRAVLFEVGEGQSEPLFVLLLGLIDLILTIDTLVDAEALDEGHVPFLQTIVYLKNTHFDILSKNSLCDIALLQILQEK